MPTNLQVFLNGQPRHGARFTLLTLRQVAYNHEFGDLE